MLLLFITILDEVEEQTKQDELEKQHELPPMRVNVFQTPNKIWILTTISFQNLPLMMLWLYLPTSMIVLYVMEIPLIPDDCDNSG
jgi:hypothetical protein